ncbi:MAG: hypothetical protein ACLTZM_10595 [Ruminococcus sp.]
MKEGNLVFDINGEFITEITREWFYTGEKSYETIIEILMDSMTGTDKPEAQIRRYAEDILLGRAALKGSAAAGTYHLEIYEPGEEEQMPQRMNIWKEIERRKKIEKDLRRMIERWDVAMDHISESTQREIRKKLGEETAEDRQQDALDSFMARMMDEEEHTTEDYGWLGTERNLPCSRVGRSSGMGERLSGQEPTQEERFAAMVEINASGMVKNSPDVIGAADYLVRRGWVLLHNPQQGIAIPTRDITREYTKAQKEFLYDYYMERDCKKRRTQYGRRAIRDEQSNFNGASYQRSRGEIHPREKFICNCQIHTGSR